MSARGLNSTDLTASPPFSAGFLADSAEAADSGALAADPLSLLLKSVHILRQRENAESAVKASQRRRAPKPGGAVQRNRNLLRRPRKTSPVHRGRHDQPITRPIITASQIGTAQSKMSTNVSVMEGLRRNSTRSKNGSSIFSSGDRRRKEMEQNFFFFPRKYFFPRKWRKKEELHGSSLRKIQNWKNRREKVGEDFLTKRRWRGRVMLDRESFFSFWFI